MSGATDNYGFILVEEGEAYDEDVLNSNNKTADKELKKVNDAIIKVAHAEFTGGAVNYPLSVANWGVGTLTADAGMRFNNTFVVANASDQLKILQNGLYMFQWLLATTSAPPEGEMIIKNSTTNVNIASDGLKRGVTWSPMLSGTAYVKADQLINFFTINRAGAFAGSSRIKITKVQG